MFAFISVALIFCLVNMYFLFTIMCAWKEILKKKKTTNPSPNIRSRIQEVFLVPSYTLMTFLIDSIFICLVLNQHNDSRNYLVYSVCSHSFSWDEVTEHVYATSVSIWIETGLYLCHHWLAWYILVSESFGSKRECISFFFVLLKLDVGE